MKKKWEDTLYRGLCLCMGLQMEPEQKQEVLCMTTEAWCKQVWRLKERPQEGGSCARGQACKNATSNYKDLFFLFLEEDICDKWKLTDDREWQSSHILSPPGEVRKQTSNKGRFLALTLVDWAKDLDNFIGRKVNNLGHNFWFKSAGSNIFFLQRNECVPGYGITPPKWVSFL